MNICIRFIPKRIAVLNRGKMLYSRCGAECVQAVGSSLFSWSSFFIHFSFISCLPPTAAFHTKGRLPPKVVLHRRSSFTYHNTLVDLTIKIPISASYLGLNFFLTNIFLDTDTKPHVVAAPHHKYPVPF